MNSDHDCAVCESWRAGSARDGAGVLAASAKNPTQQLWNFWVGAAAKSCAVAAHASPDGDSAASRAVLCELVLTSAVEWLAHPADVYVALCAVIGEDAPYDDVSWNHLWSRPQTVAGCDRVTTSAGAAAFAVDMARLSDHVPVMPSPHTCPFP